MATQVNGRQILLREQYDTYAHWREYALSHGVNVDFSFGNQCWDICCLLWIQYGLFLYLGPLGYAYEAYAVSRDRNAVFPFSKVTNVRDIKRGDCIVFWPSGLNYTGHICFADEDYNGTAYLKCLGQNQGQGIGWGTPSNVVTLNLSRFCGGFRNKNWEEPEPTPQVKKKPQAKGFPWQIYARKFRNGRR